MSICEILFINAIKLLLFINTTYYMYKIIVSLCDESVFGFSESVIISFRRYPVQKFELRKFTQRRVQRENDGDYG